MAISASDSRSHATKAVPAAEVECVKCFSCGFMEDCTPAYISRVRARYHGRWICGLCMEAVKDEVLRSEKLISTEEALNRHINFCRKFRSSSGSKTEHPIAAFGRRMRRSLDSPKVIRLNSTGALPTVEEARARPLVRAGSCFPSLSVE